MANDAPTGKIHWYQKPDGTYLDESEQSAWQVHKSYLDPRVGYKYIGWSDGRFIIEVTQKIRIKKDKDTGMLPQMPEEQQEMIREATKKEIEFAKEHPEPPADLSRQELIGGARGVVGTPVTKGLDRMMR